MVILRSPHGCPWDRKQTRHTLRPYLLEETYEAIDAIDRDDPADVCEELGDVLFQCVFQAQVAAEAGEFDLADSIRSITDKLIRRHPHVFTEAGEPLPRNAAARRGVRTPAAVRQRWEALKAKEQARAGRAPRVLGGVPRSLPALLRANKIGARASSVGFDWTRTADVLDKIDEEVRELRAAMREGAQRRAEELGDVLFSIVNLARKLKIDPESALQTANDRFTRRFDAMEARFETSGSDIHRATPGEMNAAWDAVKNDRSSRATSTSRRSSSARASGGRRSRP